MFNIFIVKFVIPLTFNIFLTNFFNGEEENIEGNYINHIYGA